MTIYTVTNVVVRPHDRNVLDGIRCLIDPSIDYLSLPVYQGAEDEYIVDINTTLDAAQQALLEDVVLECSNGGLVNTVPSIATKQTVTKSGNSTIDVSDLNKIIEVEGTGVRELTLTLGAYLAMPIGSEIHIRNLATGPLGQTQILMYGDSVLEATEAKYAISPGGDGFLSRRSQNAFRLRGDTELSWSVNFSTVFSGGVNFTNASLGVPRRKIVVLPDGPEETPIAQKLVAIWTDNHDQFASSDDGGLTWDRMTDSAANPYDSINMPQLWSYIDYHVCIAVDKSTGDVWSCYPYNNEIRFHKISSPVTDSSDIGAQWTVTTDTGINKRAVIGVTDTDVFIITRTVNNAVGNIRWFRYDKTGSLQDSGFVEDTTESNVRVGIELWDQTPVIVAWKDDPGNDADSFCYYVWNGSGFTAPTHSLIWDSGGSSNDNTRQYCYTICGNTLHVVWTFSNLTSIRHAYINLANPTGWSYDWVVQGLVNDTDGYLYPTICAYGDADNSRLYCAYQHHFDENSPGQDLFYNVFDNGSWGDEVRLTNDEADHKMANMPTRMPSDAGYIPIMWHIDTSSPDVHESRYAKVPVI